MEVTLGKEGLSMSWQTEFPETTKCIHCKDEARIAFVAHEGMSKKDKDGPFVYEVHSNEGEGGLWLHDCASFATYLCKECLKPTTLFNQA